MEAQLTLRKPNEADLSIFYQQQADPLACQMAQFPSRNETEFYQHWQTIMLMNDVSISTIEHDGNVIGNLVNWDQNDQNLIGFWLGREFWGQGFATQALMSFLQNITRPVQAYVHQENFASQRVLEKCGFIPYEQIDGEDGIEILFRLD
ncbi:MAG: GNAT family N-acetyltransferase [Parashewanella sp.]